MLLPTAALTACGPYPDDVEGTLYRVETQHRIRLGLAEVPAPARPAADMFLRRIAKGTGATLDAPREGSSEELFAALENGELDLVVAEVAEDSPWLPDVAVIEPLAERRSGERKLGLSAVVRNGENRWIMLLEREARDMKGGQ